MEILGAMDDQWRYCGYSEDGSVSIVYRMKTTLLPVSFRYVDTSTSSMIRRWMSLR